MTLRTHCVEHETLTCNGDKCTLWYCCFCSIKWSEHFSLYGFRLEIWTSSLSSWQLLTLSSSSSPKWGRSRVTKPNLHLFVCVCVCCIQRLQFLKHLLSYGEASLPPPSPPAGPQTLSSDALRQWRSNLHQPIKKTSQIMPQSAGDVTAFSHVNPSDRKKKTPPLLPQT